jgi:hypothetical protein
VNKVLEGFSEDAQVFGIVHSPKGFIQFEKIISNLLKTRRPLMDRLESLQGLFSFSSKNDWVSIYVARECFVRLFTSTGQKPTFSGGTDHSTKDKLEGDLIELIEEAFEELNIESSAEHYARGAVAGFDHDLNGFKPRQSNKVR